MKRLTKVLGLALVAQLFSVAMVFAASNHNGDQPSYDEVCRGFANKVFDEYAKCDHNLAVYDKAFAKWLEFAENFGESTTQAEVNSCIEYLEACRAEFKQPTEFTLTDSEVAAFRGEGIKVADFLSHNIEYEAFYTQMCTNIDILIVNVQQTSVSMLIDGSILSYECDPLSLEISYLSMLHTFSQLSDNLYNKSLTERIANLNYQFDIDLHLEASEYQRMVDAKIQKIQRIVKQLAEQTNQMGKDVMVASELEERFNSACQALDVAAEPLMSLDSVLLTPEDTKESARAKIEHAIAVIDNFEACAQEYIEAFGALCEALGVDTTKAEEERSTLANIVGECNKGIESMKQTYESLGFGKFE